MTSLKKGFVSGPLGCRGVVRERAESANMGMIARGNGEPSGARGFTDSLRGREARGSHYDDFGNILSQMQINFENSAS